MRATRAEQQRALRDDARAHDHDAPDSASDSPLVAGHPNRGASAPSPEPSPEPSTEPSPEGAASSEGEDFDFWSDQSASGLRERWRDLQLRFVDDPRAAATEADAVLKETIEALGQSLQAARADLSDWRDQHEGDTEGLRQAMQRYRTVLDRVLSL